MLSFKPEAKPMWDKSKENIINYISGNLTVKKVTNEQARGIDDEAEARVFLQEALDHPNKFIALDSETTGLYPRDGYWLRDVLLRELDKLRQLEPQLRRLPFVQQVC